MTNFLKKILFKPWIARIIVRSLAWIHQRSYAYIGSFATAIEKGLHPKHRIITYHDFFVKNVDRWDRVLDIGCGNGFLLKKVAEKTRADAIGVDISEKNVVSARANLIDFPNVDIVHSDIWDFDHSKKIEVIILSNVLEHLDNREELLKQLNKKFKPKRFLIRVPMFERDWLVAYKKEIGIEYRLDPTHRLEYTENEFIREMSKAGLEIKMMIFKWGEIMTVVEPQERGVNV